MAVFDPDAYLSGSAPKPFDPDAYLGGDAKTQQGPQAALKTTFPSQVPTYPVLFAGLKGLDDRISPALKDSFSQVDRTSKDPEEGRAKVIVQSYLKDQGIPDTLMSTNSQAVVDTYAKEKFGVDKKGISYKELYGLIGKRMEEQAAQGAPDPGEIRAPNTYEKAAQLWEKATGGLFSSGPKNRPAHEEGVETEWSDIPHVLGGMALETLLNPGTLLTGAAGQIEQIPKAVVSGVSKAFGAYMVGSSAKQLPALAKELDNPDVSTAQFAGDTIGLLGGAALGAAGLKAPMVPHVEPAVTALGNAIRVMPPEEATTLLSQMHGDTPAGVASTLQKAAAEATPEVAEHLAESASNFQKIADAEPPEVKKLGEAAKAWDEVKSVLAPASRGPEAEIAAGALREHGGELAQRADRAAAALEGASKDLMKLSPEKRLDFIDGVESGSEQPTPELQAAADNMRQILDTKRDEIRGLGTGKLDHFIKDYFPHIWEDPEEAANVFQKAAAKAPLQGSKSFLKERTIPTTREGVALGLKPVSTNPVELVLLKAREMDRYLLGQKWMQEMKDRNLVQYVRSGDKPPEGMEEINDSIATVYGKPSHPGAMQIEGKYMAPSGVATVANNYLSPGLRRYASFRSYLSVANSLNQFQLGLSAFHLGLTSFDTSISKMALALEYGAEGKIGTAVKEGAKIPVAPVSTLLQGNKGLKEWMRPGSQGEEIGKLIDAVKVAGGRAKMDSFYQTTITKKMNELFGQGGAKGYLGALWRVPFAAMEQMSKPIMEYVVPRQKMGIAMDMMRKELAKLPADADHLQLRKVADKVWDSVDNRMGQMVYDNLFWNKAAKDMAMASVRSVGWNLGTLRELGGGVMDTAAFARDVFKAKPKAFSDVADFKATQSGMGVMPDFDLYNLKEDLPGHPKDSTVSEKTLKDAGYELTPKQKAEFTHRMAYAVALPVFSGILGATYQYLKTGKGPEELRDYFFPKTGEKDPQGRDVRLALPTYMKDIYHYAHDPVGTVEGKVHPAISMAIQMLNNKDYFGREIRHSDDPVVKQMQDEANHFIENFLPIGIRNLETSQASGQSAGEKAANFVGITRAPAWVGETDAEQLAGKLAGDRFKSPTAPDTKLVAEKQKIQTALRNGTPEEKAKAKEELSAMQERGDITSVQRRNLIKGTDHTYLENAVSHLDAREAMRVFSAASVQERQSIAQAIHRKIETAHLPHEDKKSLLEKYRELNPARDIDHSNR